MKLELVTGGEVHVCRAVWMVALRCWSNVHTVRLSNCEAYNRLSKDRVG